MKTDDKNKIKLELGRLKKEHNRACHKLRDDMKSSGWSVEFAQASVEELDGKYARLRELTKDLLTKPGSKHVQDTRDQIARTEKQIAKLLKLPSRKVIFPASTGNKPLPREKSK
jgi:hypothetical protein